MNEKYLIIHNRYKITGGEDTVFNAETSLLKRHGHHVIEYVENNQRIQVMNQISVALKTIWSRTTKNRVLNVLHRSRPDVAHFHNTFPLISPSAYLACREVNIPVIQTLHNFRLLCPAATLFRYGQVCEKCLNRCFPSPGVIHACYRGSRVGSAVIAMMLFIHHLLKTWPNRVELYIALTEFSRNKFIEGGLPAEKIVVKPNFIYPDPGISKSRGDYVLFVGRLSQEKGIKILLKSWQHIKSIPIKIVGDGPLMYETMRFVKTKKLRSVEILGHQPYGEVINLIKGARFIFFPAECYENFPMVIAEAFACGVPVIASRLGAMETIVEDGRTGLLFTPADVQDIVGKVEQAWMRPERMKEIGQEARKEYEEKYTAERNYKMLMSIYKDVINEYKRNSK